MEDINNPQTVQDASDTGGSEAVVSPAGYEGDIHAESDAAQTEIDYAAVLDADIAELKSAFPELGDLEDIYGLSNPVRFGALRDLGLSATEAYLASGGKRTVYDNRRHLTASVPRTARSAVEHMPRRELDMMKELFGDMSDSEIHKLYRKVKG